MSVMYQNESLNSSLEKARQLNVLDQNEFDIKEVFA